MAYQLTYRSFGERSILIEWPKIINKEILKDILSFKKKIHNSFSKEILQVNHAYNSLLIIYDFFNSDNEKILKKLEGLYDSDETDAQTVFRRWKIPVCYDTEFAIDIETLGTLKKLSTKEIITRHTQIRYTVYFIGFLPGFLYLGGLDEILYTPRKAMPRLKVEKGAVAIGGEQTGVYPNESPGGWNVIGNSPINFFNMNLDTPCFASAGDQIQFYAISKKQHSDIKTLVEAGVYQIESEVIND